MRTRRLRNLIDHGGMQQPRPGIPVPGLRLATKRSPHFTVAVHPCKLPHRAGTARARSRVSQHRPHAQRDAGGFPVECDTPAVPASRRQADDRARARRLRRRVQLERRHRTAAAAGLKAALVQYQYPTGPGGETSVEFAINPASLREAFAADLPAEQTALMAATQRPVAAHRRGHRQPGVVCRRLRGQHGRNDHGPSQERSHQMDGRPNLVLVHGAWADGSHGSAHGS